jgi:hypothetical protein
MIAGVECITRDTDHDDEFVRVTHHKILDGSMRCMYQGVARATSPPAMHVGMHEAREVQRARATDVVM